MADLAMLGGEPHVPSGLLKPWPHITDADRAAVAEAVGVEDIRTQRTLQGEGLAKEWAEFLGVKYCLPTNSGTSALHIALAAAGVEPGDEVICPAFTFWATAAAVLHQCAIPVFVDVESETFCLDPAKLEAAITPRTKAVMPVHVHGMPADLGPILAICQRHNLRLIEDACQAHGAEYQGRKVGSIGDGAGFSTQQSKCLTTGSEGGLYVTNDEGMFIRGSHLIYFGERVVPGKESETQEYNARGLGWMYRGDVFGQAFCRSQLKRLAQSNATRAENAARLTARLSQLPGVRCMVEPSGRRSAWYNYVVGVSPEPLGLDLSPDAFRTQVMRALAAEGVPVNQWQRMPVPAQDVFQHQQGFGRGWPWSQVESQYVYSGDDFPCAQDFLARHFYVPGIWPPNGAAWIDAAAGAFEKVWERIAAVVEHPVT